MTYFYNYYVLPADHLFMEMARDIALNQPPSKQPYQVGILLVKDDEVIAAGNNYNKIHAEQGCVRRDLGVPSGKDYHLCAGCSAETHAEPQAIKMAKENGIDTTGSIAIMWGHYHCCEDCTKALRQAGITDVYIVEDAKTLFATPAP